MKPVALAEGIYWVGAVDWNLRSFHGYATHRGSTYNAYLIVDDKIALVDSVKASFWPEMRERMRQVVDPQRIDYVIANHVEMDHSGSLPQIMPEAHRARLITIERHGETGLQRTFHAPWPLLPMKDGQQLELGKRRLTFMATPMLHWPDSMMTYVEPDGILLPNDAFGQHLATSQRFDDEADLDVVMAEAQCYYANIFMPYSSQAAKALERVRGLKLTLIAPSHGVMWRSHIHTILQAYEGWSHGQTRERLLVIYDTMWGSTEKMAQAIVEGAGGEGVEVKFYNLAVTETSDIIGDVMEARALAVGSSTLNNGMLPTVAAFLSYLKGLRPRGKVGVAFGSYGWGGGATKAIREELRQAGMEVLDTSLDVKFVPDGDELARCIQLGGELARRVKAQAGGTPTPAAA